VRRPAPSALTLLPPRNGLPYRIVFVCTGNICRSPMAEIITRTMAGATDVGDGSVLGTHLEVSSAGTGPWHDGDPMHDNTAAALARGGYPDHPHVARQILSARLGQFDLLVALDRKHQQTLRGLGADPLRVVMLRAFDGASGAAVDVPDPYYGDAAVFDDCRRMIEAACRGLVDALVVNWSELSGG
jgi:protein-tyrosine phosphatase